MPRRLTAGAKTNLPARGVFDKETRRKPLAFAADAAAIGIERRFGTKNPHGRPAVRRRQALLTIDRPIVRLGTRTKVPTRTLTRRKDDQQTAALPCSKTSSAIRRPLFEMSRQRP
jgi:hypothetical protein